jgi:cyanophycin synthetase
MTNIAADHIGQDGICNTEDIVYIKSLVAERVREGGTLILNADDEHLSRLMEIPRVSRLKRQVVYFSMHENSLLVKKHRASGGTAFFVKNGWIFEARNFRESKLVHVEGIPVTLGGLAEFNVANSLAAIAAAREYGLTREEVAGGMMSFRSVEHNAGRANLFQVNGGYVMLDYGHNSDAFAAVCRTASQWKDRRVTGVIGVPGDRADSVIKEAGRAASNGFHRIVIKEDRDTRGRQRGEVASILFEAVKEAAPERECVTVLDDLQAIRGELQRIGERDILVVFYDKLKPVLEVLDQAGAMPVSTIASLAARASAGGA